MSTKQTRTSTNESHNSGDLPIPTLQSRTRQLEQCRTDTTHTTSATTTRCPGTHCHRPERGVPAIHTRKEGNPTPGAGTPKRNEAATPPPIWDSAPTPQPYEVPDEPSEEAALSCDDRWLDPELPPRLLYQPPTPISDAQPLLQPLDHNGYDVTDYHNELDNGAASAEPEPDSIERLTFTQELELLGQGYGDWTTKMEIGIGAQGEYTPATYSPLTNTSPTLSCTTTPTPTSTSFYTPPRPSYKPCRAWLKPPRTRYTPQRTPYRPYACPQRKRRPPRENQTRHVTATQRNDFRATSHVEHAGPPKYIVPGLCK